MISKLKKLFSKKQSVPQPKRVSEVFLNGLKVPVVQGKAKRVVRLVGSKFVTDVS